MASFVGTFDEFIKYISPRARNVVNGLSRNYKKKVGQCENCKSKTATLEAAHIIGRERPKIIEEILQPFINDEVVTIDLEVFESNFLEEHEPIEKNIRVLCRPCHRAYDAPVGKNIEKDMDVFTESLTDEENKLITNSEITDFIRQIVPRLSDVEVENLLDMQYCKEKFEIVPKLAILKEIPFDSNQESIRKLARVKNHIRWSPKKTVVRNSSRYLVLTQWYDRNRLPFIRWKERIEKSLNA